MTLAAVITDIGNVTTMVVSLVSDILAVFLEPPLIIFIGMAIAGSVFMLTRRLIRRR